MQGLELSRALSEIVAQLKIEALVDLMEEIVTGPPGHSMSDDEVQEMRKLAFESRTGLIQLQEEDPTKFDLARAFHLPDALSEERFGNFLTQMPQWGKYTSAQKDLNFLHTYATIKAFLRLSATVEEKLETDRIGPIEEGHALLELEIDDYGERLVRIRRVSELLEATSALYDTILQIQGVDENELRIVLLDSGTPLKVVFEGAEGAIDAIRRLFTWALNAWRFRGLQQQEREWEHLQEGLDVLSVIREHEEEGDLDPEVAERYRRDVQEQLDAILGRGGMPEGLESGTEDRQALLETARQQLLLEPGEENHGG